MTKEFEMFNQHQQDVRTRTDSLAKAIFVLSGGSLTVSIGIFLKGEPLPLTHHSLIALKYSWWSLFASIVLGVAMLTTIIVRDYRFGERWRKVLDNVSNIDISGVPRTLEFFIIIFGVLAILSFILGIFGLAFVAAETVSSGLHS
ncbi:hypothetical protein BCU45_003000 [Vibrio lentus]|uniref:hypothetical protein n=1 Tax=Vibrio lentus TaxID=136468 RepID=UPI000C82A061|nr:hypothetical protein [Vibrio lentus]PMI43059.1 hypothetical protein BCU45_11950 [Vibrio lentus]PMJ57867.1 hypothetical protein BCU20_17035 [Vibrio lentus]